MIKADKWTVFLISIACLFFLIKIGGILAVDTDPPIVNLNDPQDGETEFNRTVEFAYSISDASLIDNCKLLIDGSVAKTDANPDKADPDDFIHTLNDGTYTWAVQCTDNESNVGTSTTFDLTVDLDEEGPDISLEAGVGTDNIGIIDFEYTPEDDSDLKWCALFVNDILIENDTSVTENSLEKFEDIELPDGEYIWAVECQDEFENIGRSANAILEIEDTAPQIILISPINKSVISSGSALFEYNATSITNVQISYCDLILDGEKVAREDEINNSTIESFAFRGFEVGTGLYTWSINCTNDNDREEGSENRTVQVIGATGGPNFPPSISLIRPNNNEEVKSGNINFRYNPSDNTPIASCSFFINDTEKASDNEILNNTENSFSSDLSVGTYNWFVRCENSGGLKSQSPMRSLKVVSQVTQDVTPPTILLAGPINNATRIDGNITFEFTPLEDAATVSSCSLYIDGQVHENDSAVTNKAINRFIDVEIGEGQHTWEVECEDSFGNKGRSPIRTFVILGSKSNGLGAGTITTIIIVVIIILASLIGGGFYLYKQPSTGPEIQETLERIKRKLSEIGIPGFRKKLGEEEKLALEKEIEDLTPTQKAQLRAFIQQMMAQGHHKDAIINHLIKFNWKKEHIEDIIAEIELTPQMKLQLEQAINELKLRGWGKEQIKIEMIGRRWQPHHVELVLKKMFRRD